jgi:hypothetical protein
VRLCGLDKTPPSVLVLRSLDGASSLLASIVSSPSEHAGLLRCGRDEVVLKFAGSCHPPAPALDPSINLAKRDSDCPDSRTSWYVILPLSSPNRVSSLGGVYDRFSGDFYCQWSESDHLVLQPSCRRYAWSPSTPLAAVDKLHPAPRYTWMASRTSWVISKSYACAEEEDGTVVGHRYRGAFGQDFVLRGILMLAQLQSACHRKV